MHVDGARIFSRIVGVGFCCLVAVTPILALPWTVSPLEGNKHAFFLLASIVIIMAMVGEILVQRRMLFRPSIWWGVVGIFLVGTSISAVLSKDVYTSVFGQLNQEYTSAVTVVMLILLLFAGVHVLGQKERRQVVLWSLVGSAAVNLWALTAFFGGTSGKIPVNLIGTPNALAIYGLGMTVLGYTMVIKKEEYSSRFSQRILSISTFFTAITTFFVLLAIDYSVLWCLAFFGAGVSIIFAMVHKEFLQRPLRLVLPILLLVASGVFFFAPTFLQNPFPAEVALTSTATRAIVHEAARNGVWIFGTGPGTFSLLFSKYQNADINLSTFWDTRFDRGSSGLLTMLPTFGFLTTAMFILMILGTGWLGIRAYFLERSSEVFSVFSAWLVFAVSYVVYPQNMTIVLMFWILTTLLWGNILPPPKKYVFEHRPRMALGVTFLSTVFAVLVLAVGFAAVARYRADIAFARAITFDAQGGDIDAIIRELDAAATVNRWSDVYYRNLSSALLRKVTEIVQQPDADSEYVKLLIGAAVNASVRATEISPNTVANWEMRGEIYREISPFIADAAQFAVVANEQAVALSPQNPRYRVALARAYLALADVLIPLSESTDDVQAAEAQAAQNIAFEKAQTVLMEAIALKSDYPEARYYLAFVQERQGKLAEAVASMELVRERVPRDVGVGLQLALLYLRQGKNVVAEKELQRILSIAPNFTNAYWYLAVILEEAGDVNGAIAALETILDIDPHNDVVTKKIATLQIGRASADTIPDPLTTSP